MADSISPDAQKLIIRLRSDFYAGVPLSQVMVEFKALTEKDKTDLVDYYNAGGLPTKA